MVFRRDTSAGHKHPCRAPAPSRCAQRARQRGSSGRPLDSSTGDSASGSKSATTSAPKRQVAARSVICSVRPEPRWRTSTRPWKTWTSLVPASRDVDPELGPQVLQHRGRRLHREADGRGGDLGDRRPPGRTQRPGPTSSRSAGASRVTSVPWSKTIRARPSARRSRPAPKRTPTSVGSVPPSHLHSLGLGQPARTRRGDDRGPARERIPSPIPSGHQGRRRRERRDQAQSPTGREGDETGFAAEAVSTGRERSAREIPARPPTTAGSRADAETRRRTAGAAASSSTICSSRGAVRTSVAPRRPPRRAGAAHRSPSPVGSRHDRPSRRPSARRNREASAGCRLSAR